jgi:hypothetical protein
MHSGSIPQDPGNTIDEVIGYFPVLQMIGLLDLHHLAHSGPCLLQYKWRKAECLAVRLHVSLNTYDFPGIWCTTMSKSKANFTTRRLIDLCCSMVATSRSLPPLVPPCHVPPLPQSHTTPKRPLRPTPSYGTRRTSRQDFQRTLRSISNDANPRGLGAFLENQLELTYSYPTGCVRKPVMTQSIGSSEQS